MLLKSYIEKVRLYDIGNVWTVVEADKFVREEYSLPSSAGLSTTAPLSVYLSGGLPGGKGGFGSLLRSIGAQIEKTTNHEAMRDLSGRRQRDVNNEERLKKFVAGRAEREKVAREKKQQKLEKLRRLAEGENKDKLSFADPVYDKVRSETEEKVHDAVEAALTSANPSGSGTGTKADCPDTKQKRKSSGADSGPVEKKAKGLWLGGGLDDLEDSDLTDSEDEEKPLDS